MIPFLIVVGETASADQWTVQPTITVTTEDGQSNTYQLIITNPVQQVVSAGGEASPIPKPEETLAACEVIGITGAVKEAAANPSLQEGVPEVSPILYPAYITSMEQVPGSKAVLVQGEPPVNVVSGTTVCDQIPTVAALQSQIVAADLPSTEKDIVINVGSNNTTIDPNLLDSLITIPQQQQQQ